MRGLKPFINSLLADADGKLVGAKGLNGKEYLIYTTINDEETAPLTDYAAADAVVTDAFIAADVVTLATAKAYADSLELGLLNDRGGYDASSNLFPATGGSGIGGAIKEGDIWFISVAGTLGGVYSEVGSSIRALTDIPGQTAGNWNLIQTMIGFVPENVANKSNSVVTDQASNIKYPSVKAVFDWATAAFAAMTTQTMGDLINSAAAKTTPVNADYVGLVDSEAGNIIKKLSWSSLKAALKTYFDTIYTTSSGYIAADVVVTDAYIASDAAIINGYIAADAVVSAAITAGDAATLLTAQSYAEDLALGLLDDRGSYDASTNLFPAFGGSGTGGAVKKGDIWFISVAGTLGGAPIQVGSSVRALSDAPGQNVAQWNIIATMTTIGYVAENAANKSTSIISDQASIVKYPSVKAVYDWANASFSALGSQATSGSYLVSGGGVGFTTDLTFTVSAATYVINGVNYSSPETTLTAAAADPVNPRIDLIVLTTSGTAIVLTGTTAVNPERPEIDPNTQLALTFYIVNATATATNVIITDIYHENTEYTTSRSGTTFTLASTVNPHTGTKCIEGTAVTTGNYVQFTAPSNIDMANHDNLVFYIRSKALWPSTRRLTIALLLSTAQKGSIINFEQGSFGFDSANITNYQQIVIPTSLFFANGILVNVIRISCTGSGTNLGMYLDDITLQGGSIPLTDTTKMRWRGVYSATNAYAINDACIYNGMQYVAIASSTGSTPDTSAAWQLSGANMVLSSAQSVTGTKTFDTTKLAMKGTSTGVTALASANSGSSNYTITLPAATGTLALTSDIGPGNATHTGDATGATNLTVVGINGTPLSGLATGILKNTTSTGVPSIAVAGDFPTLNQNTTGSAAKLTTARTIGGISFDGSANINQPYEVGAFYPGKPSASALLMLHVFNRNVSFPSSLTGSHGFALQAATAQTDFDILKNGVSFGTMRFAAAATTATFIAASSTTFVAGEVLTDVLMVVAPSTPDATLENITFLLAGTR